MEYRIVKKTKSNGTERFYVQKRFLGLFWIYVCYIGLGKRVFSCVDGARLYIMLELGSKGKNIITQNHIETIKYE